MSLDLIKVAEKIAGDLDGTLERLELINQTEKITPRIQDADNPDWYEVRVTETEIRITVKRKQVSR